MIEDANPVEDYLQDNAENNRYMGEGTPAYAPQRDILALFPVAVNQLWLDIDEDTWNKRYSSLMKKWKLEKNQVLHAFNLYVDTMTHFQQGVAATFDEAADLTGFSELNPRLVLLIEAMIGRYVAAAYFYGLKDVTIQGEDPPPFAGYDTFHKLLEEIKDGLDGVESEYARQLKEFSLKELDNAKEGEGSREGEDREEEQGEGKEV